MDDDDIDRLLAQLGLELPDTGDDEEAADRFIEGWDDDTNPLAGWEELR